MGYTGVMRNLFLRGRGFTLIELLVVIAIIGILAGIIITGLSGAKASGRDGKRISDIKNIQLALGVYYNDNFKYPYQLSSLETGYISKVPKDPNGSDYFYSPLGLSSACTYQGVGPQKYHLGAVLEGSKMPDDNANRVVGSGGYVSCDNYASDFQGASPDCGPNTGTDNCYDVVPN